MNAHSEDEYWFVLCSTEPCGKGEMMALYLMDHWCHSIKKLKLIMNIALILAPEDMQKYLEIQRKQDITSLM